MVGNMINSSRVLVIVDSITAGFRTSEFKEKAKLLHAVAERLKALDCYVVVSNQVRAEMGSGNFQAALGTTWSQAVTSRLLVVREGARRFVKHKNVQVEFQVSTEAVCELSFCCVV